MKKDIYHDIESEFKKYKYFGRDNLTSDVAMIITLIVVYTPSLLLLYLLKSIVITYCAAIAILLLELIGFLLVRDIKVYRFMKIPENRQLLQSVVEENAKYSIKKLDLSKPLKISCVFRLKLIFKLWGLMKKARPSIVDILIKNGIDNADSFEKLKNHYRSEVGNYYNSKNDLFNTLISIILSVIISATINLISNRPSLLLGVIIIFSFILLLSIFALYIKKYFSNLYGEITFHNKIKSALDDITLSDLLGENTDSPEQIFEDMLMAKLEKLIDEKNDKLLNEIEKKLNKREKNSKSNSKKI